MNPSAAPTSKDIQEAVANYRPGPQVVNLVRSVPIVLLSGITGAGKDTIKFKLLQTDKYYQLITHTTREPRSNNGVLEQDGIDYHFIDMAGAWDMLQNQGYVETNWFNNNVYGVSVAEIERAQAEAKICMGDVDVNGAGHIVELSPLVKLIYIVPPSYDEWQHRLLKRYSGLEPAGYQDDLQRRLQINKQELEFALAHDYFYFVVNDNLDECVAAVDMLAQSEKLIAGSDGPARAVALDILRRIPQAN